MTLARWQATITDEEGNVLPGASIEVRREASGAPLAALYSDRDGVTPLGNPFAADADGFAGFHVVGGSYRITAVSGGVSRVWRYVAIGKAAEADTLTAGITWLFDDATADADPGPGLLRLNNAVIASTTQIYFDDLSSFGVDVGDYLDSFDDGGSAGDRGVLTLAAADASGFLVARVTGTVVDGTGYRKVSVTHLSSGGAFVVDAPIAITFARAGVDGQDGTDGTGTVNGPLAGSPGVTVGELAVFSNVDGQHIDGSGKTINNVGAGKQTIWLPGASMLPNGASPPLNVVAIAGSNVVVIQTRDCDPTTEEYLYFTVAMPKGWDEGTLSFEVIWSHAATVTNFGVVFQLYANAFGNDDSLSQNAGTPGTVIDTGGTTDDLYISPESSAITVAGSPAEGDTIFFRLNRVPGNGSDTLAVDARVHGIRLFYSTNANTDA